MPRWAESQRHVLEEYIIKAPWPLLLAVPDSNTQEEDISDAMKVSLGPFLLGSRFFLLQNTHAEHFECPQMCRNRESSCRCEANNTWRKYQHNR
jgi:hypothetical protein